MDVSGTDMIIVRSPDYLNRIKITGNEKYEKISKEMQERSKSYPQLDGKVLSFGGVR